MATKSELRRRRVAAANGDANSTSSSESAGVNKKKAVSKKDGINGTPADEVDPNQKLFRRKSVGGGYSVNMTMFDVGVCFALLAAAAAVRFHRLSSPQAVIFDEVHYLKFIRWTLRGEYFFDVNPVFGKLALAFFAKMFSFDTALPDYDTPGDSLPSAAVAFAARAPAAIFGALTVPVFYRVCRLLRLSTTASILGASFILLDMMHIIQSRIAMVDSVLVFFTCLSLAFALMMWNAKNVAILKRQSISFKDIFNLVITLCLTGITSGLAVSTRWTAFATPVVISVISLFGIPPFCYEPLNAFECLILFASMAFSYFSTFAMFFWQVGKTGTGDAFMSEQFRKCLVGSDQWTGVGACTASVWSRFKELNETIFRYSKGIRGKDKWGSSWFLWIFNYRGALYFRKDHDGGDDAGKTSLIYVLMNPAMNVVCIALIGIFFGVLFYNIRYRKKMNTSEPFRNHLRRGVILFFGWIGSMAPTMVVYRSGPLYQYLPGLFFAQALAACGFDLIPPKGRPFVGTLIIATMAAAAWYWSPWVYATPLLEFEHANRRWLPRWD